MLIFIWVATSIVKKPLVLGLFLGHNKPKKHQMNEIKTLLGYQGREEFKILENEFILQLFPSTVTTNYEPLQ